MEGGRGRWKPRRETQKESGEGERREGGRKEGRFLTIAPARARARRLRGEMEITNWGSEGEGSGAED